MRLNSWHQWYRIERMTPTGTRVDEFGKQWATFDMAVRRKWWFFLHPGYWTRPNRWRKH